MSQGHFSFNLSPNKFILLPKWILLQRSEAQWISQLPISSSLLSHWRDWIQGQSQFKGEEVGFSSHFGSIQRIRVEEACRKVSLRQREGVTADSHISVTRRERLPTISGEGIRIQDLPLPPTEPHLFCEDWTRGSTASQGSTTRLRPSAQRHQPIDL